MSQLRKLLDDVDSSRERYLEIVRDLSPGQAHFKPEEDVWSAGENTEHIARAEQSGIYGMWKAVEGAETGRPVWEGDPPHRGRSIEQVVAATWKEKEEVPPIAAPSWGGSLRFWIAMLEANAHLLEGIAGALEGHDLEAIHYPHPISGPLDMRQRLEFLRFHLDRHRAQVEALSRHPDFPVGHARAAAAS